MFFSKLTAAAVLAVTGEFPFFPTRLPARLVIHVTCRFDLVGGSDE